MGRRRQNGLEVVAALPWPVGIVLGILAFVAIRYGVGWYFSSTHSPITQEMGRQLLANGTYAPLAWMFLALCWLGALFSWLGSRKRKQLLAAQTGLDSLRTMNWREFEMLVGEAFRRRGYAIEETGLGGADGGIDLILRKDERRELVQCKQWRNTLVGVSVIREMWGLANHHGVDGVKIVSVGEFTPDAAEFARGKPIELINGRRLIGLVREVQTASALPDQPLVRKGLKLCPVCSAEMALRRNRRTSEPFWGCRRYPRCRGTNAMEGTP
ncbi:restriction endonuclease [Lysobacter terrae]